jgi:acyl-CoA thioesterase I
MRWNWRNAWASAAIGIAVAGQAGVVFAAEPTGEALSCAVSTPLTRLGAPLLRTGEEIADGNSFTILATGSSSTQGIGASSPAMSYPSRLGGDLRNLFPTVAIKIVNRGRRGLDVREEVAGLNRDIASEHPDLVIWQVGTNALLRQEEISAEERLIGQEVEAIKRQGVDTVLMDMQYAPRVLARKDWGGMERAIAEVSRRERIGYFRRFEIMREWDQSGEFAPSALIGPDGLHMTDVSYGCLAKQLARALADQWRSQNKLAKSTRRNPAAFARGPQRIVDGPN